MHKRAWVVLLFAPLLALLYSQQQDPQAQAERFKKQSLDAERKGLAEPYKGISANGTIQPGLYTIHRTGVSTAPARKAAVAFIASLSPEMRKKTVFPVDDIEWRKWMNQDFYVRQGAGFLDMTDDQKEAAFAMMKASLSAKGMQLSRDIMRLNYTLGELNNNDFVRYGEWRYWITIMGEPSATKPWGWQIDGHHLIVNYFVLGDQVVMSPVFIGSEPVIAPSGKYKGLSILQDEQNMGRKMILALDDAQRKKAVLEVSKTGNNNLAEAFKDNIVLDYAGAPVSGFDAAQKKQLLALINEYVRNMDDGHAKIKMEEVRKHIDETFFAWIGGTGDTSVYYYRIHSPVLLIEFDHQRPVGMRHLSPNPNLPFKEHIHAVIRTPNGNDYGKDLLRQHYLQYPHL
jgi:hypothetical protein